jgi:hypothetical protein
MRYLSGIGKKRGSIDEILIGGNTLAQTGRNQVSCILNVANRDLILGDCLDKQIDALLVPKLKAISTWAARAVALVTMRGTRCNA